MKKNLHTKAQVYSAKAILTHFQKLLLLLILSLTSVGVFGQTTVTFDVSSLGASSITQPSGSIDTNIAFSSAQGSGTANTTYFPTTDIRLYWQSSGASNGSNFTLTPSNSVTITKVVIYALSTYIPTVKFNVDGGSDQTLSASGSTYTISGLSAATSLKFRNANTTNMQLRFSKLDITYSLPCTAPTSSFASATVAKNIGDANFTNAFTTNSAGAVSYTSSNTSVATINTSTGDVTIGSTTGTTTITATQAANGTNCAATTTYTLTVNAAVVTNITGGGVNIVGKFQNPGYQQPINCDTNDKRVLQYRKVSTTTSNPSDGRGQWATTLNAVSSPSTNLSLGQVYAGNYDPNPSGDGFVFTNGGGCGNTGSYANKWNFSGNGQCTVDGVSIANYVTGGGANMGINASSVGFYTFVLKDNTGSTNGYYVGYTTNAPIAISSTSQSMLCPSSAVITATLSGVPSSQEKFYLRYNTTNDFSGSTATSQVLGTVSGTTVTFNVSSLAAATTYNYYILSTTVGGYTSLSEVDKSLSCLKFLDNGGTNYSLTTRAPINISAQPVANSYCQNAPPTALSVSATGASLTYQWYNNGVTNSNTGGSLITGATSATLAASNISTTSAGTTYYYCNIFTGTCTTPTATNAVAITVTATPVITGTTTLCVGSTTQLSGSGTANATTPWSSSNIGVANISNTGLVTSVAAGTSTITYKNSNGCTVTTLVTVNGVTAITSQPTSQSVTAGSTATFTVIASGANLTYQWQVSADCGSTWNNVSTGTGGTTASYTTPATDASIDQNKYKVIVSGSCGGSVTSTVVTLSVVTTSQCLFSDFIASEGWISKAYTASSPWTQSIGGNIWTGNGVNVSPTGTNTSGTGQIQVRDQNTWLQLPSLSNASSIAINAKDSATGTGGTDDITLQYDNAGTWTDIQTKTIGILQDYTYDVSSYAALNGLSVRFIKKSSGGNTAFIGSVTVTCTTLPTSATNYTWTGGANSTLWSDACNWSPRGVPTAVDNVTFNTTQGAGNTLNITDSRTVNNLTLNATGNFNASSTAVLTINGNVTYGGSATATLDCASQIFIKSASIQTIPPLTYGNLDVLGGARIFSPTGVIKICSGFNVNPVSYAYTVTGSTVEYTSPQSGWVMTPFTYNNLTFSGAGDFSVGYSSPAVDKAITVLGNYVQSNSTVYVGDLSSNTATLNVNGNMTLSSGTLDMNSTNGGKGTLNLKGNLVVSSTANLKATSTTVANSNFNFAGIGDGTTAALTQTIDVANPATASNINFNVNSAAYAKLSNQDFYFGTNSVFNVKTGGTFDFGFVGTNPLNLVRVSSQINQAFSAQSGSTLKITSPLGITLGSTPDYTGNVQIGSTAANRLFDAGGIYHYIGKTSQVSGNGLPAVTGKVIVEMDTPLLGFQASDNTRTIASGGNLEIRQGVVTDDTTHGFNGAGNLTMNSDNGRYIANQTGTQPSLSGTYALTAGTVEFGNTSSSASIRVTPQYYNVDVSGKNIIAGGKNFVINNVLKVIKSTSVLTIPENLSDADTPYVVTAKKGIQVLAGKALFLNNANLIQDIDAANSGNINMQRKATVPSIQYNYWSSPVIGQKLYNLYDVPDNTVMTYNSWNDKFTILPKISYPTSVFAKGYSIKGSTTMDPSLTAEFVGTPNNEISAGVNSIALSTAGSNYNLIGNPYPSNLNLIALYNDAANKPIFYDQADETPTAYFWDNTSNSDTSQIGSTYVNANYAILNLSDGTGTSAPRFGTTGKKPNGIVKPGQGFIVRAAETGGSLIFKNTFRTTSVGTAGTYFRGVAETIDKFWLILTTPNQMNIQIALTYNPEAENSFERFDSAIMSDAVTENFYSLSLDAKKLAIQGRKGNFSDTDKIPLGIKTSKTGTQKISIDEKLGVFAEGQTIYLKDKQLNIITDLSKAPYQFTSAAGVDDNRFEIVYLPETVLTTDASQKDDVQIYRDGEYFVVRSAGKIIDEVEVYDVSGRLYEKVTTKAKEVRINNSALPSGMYILKIKRNNEVISKKIIR